MQRLDRYVLRVFFQYWAVIGAALLGMFSILDLLGHGDEIGESSQGTGEIAGQVLRYYLLNLVFLVVQFAPYLTLIAGLTTVMHLAKGREWTPMLTAGRPSLRALLPVFVGAAVVAAAVTALRDLGLPRINAEREALQRRVFHQRPWQMADLLARTRADVRLQARLFRPGGAAGGEGPAELRGLEVFSLGPEGQDQVLVARRALWEGDGWRLRNGVLYTTGAEPVEVDQLRDPELRPEDLVRAYFGTVSPLDMSTADLREILARDPAHRQAATLLWAWRAAPLTHWVLLLLGLPFVFHFGRKSSLEGVAVGVLLSMLFFVAEILLRDLGGRGVLSPFLAGSGAPLLFGFLGILAVERMPS